MTIEGRPLFTIYEPVGPLTPEERAKRIEERIVAVADEESTPTTAAHFETHPGWTEIYVDKQIIMAVTELDASLAGKRRPELAADYAAAITGAIETYRQERSWRFILRGVLKTLLTTSLFVGALWILNLIRNKIRDRIERRIRTRESLAQKPFRDLVLANAGPVVLALGGIFKWLLILAILETYLTVTMGFFSSTREMSLTKTRWLLTQLESIATAAVS